MSTSHGGVTFSVVVKRPRRARGTSPGHGGVTFSVVVKRPRSPLVDGGGHGGVTFSVVVKPIFVFCRPSRLFFAFLLREKAQNGRLGRRFPAGFSGKLGAARTASYSVCTVRRLILVSRCRGGCGRPLSSAHYTKPGATAPGRREVSTTPGCSETRQGESSGCGRSALWRAAPPSIAGNRDAVAAVGGREKVGDGDARPGEARRREAGLRGCGCGMMGARQPGLRGDPAYAP